MVQILPPKTSLGTALGQSLGAGLAPGIQQGYQRGLLQNALQGLENVNPQTTPFQLASKLMQATAGIPGAEKYVGTLYPLLLQQMQNQAFSQAQGGGAGGMGASGVPSGGQPFPGATAQELTPGIPQAGTSTSGGLLGTVIPQDQIDAQANQYAMATGSGPAGYQQMQQILLNKNAIASQQRQEAMGRAQKYAGATDAPIFMQLGERHRFAKNFDEWERSTQRDYKEYKNLSTRLEALPYPGFFNRLQRESRLKEMDQTVKRLVNLGFEQDIRKTLTDKGLSPTEVEERIHPFSEQQEKALNQFKGFSAVSEAIPEAAKKGMVEKRHPALVDFLRKNITPDISLLALRQRLWDEKHVPWQEIASAMEEATTGDGAPALSTAQTNELNVLQTEPPRQSLSSIWRGWKGFSDFIQKKK